MTERIVAPTYRQRFTGLGWLGLILQTIAVMHTAGLLAAQMGAESHWDRPSGLWFIMPAALSILGPALLLIGREYYDASPQIAKAAEQAEEIKARHRELTSADR